MKRSLPVFSASLGRALFGPLAFLLCVASVQATPEINVELPSGTAVPTGSLAAWGLSSGTELTVPTGVSDLVDVSSYNGSAIGCRANGTVVTWGYGYIPNPITNGVAVGTGFGIYAVLKSDGKVVAWGFNHYGQTTVPSTLSGVSKIAVGTDHMLALKSNGTVVAWGRNDQNQCKVPAGLTGVVAIDAATYGSVALKSNGTVVAWGSSTYTSIPPGLTGVAAIAVNESGVLALKGDGTLVFWGSGSVGTLPPGLSGVTGIAMGEYHAVALKNDGTLLCWGDEYYGECTVPAGLGPVNKVYADRYRTLARFAGVNFDQHGLLDTSPVRTFTVRNTGTTALSLTSVTLTTGDAADFLLDTTGMLSSIPAGSTTSFTVAFRAQTNGTKFTTLRLVSDDGDESTLDYALTGEGVAPDIEVSGNGSPISNGDTTPATFDNTDFGTAEITATKQATFNIANTGKLDLTLNGTPRVAISGLNQGDFSVQTQPTADPLSPNASTSFILAFTPSALGVRQATISIASDAPDQNPFTFSVQGTGTAQTSEIAVFKGASTDAADELVSAANTLRMAAVRGHSSTQTITVKSAATLALASLTASIGGSNADQFQVSTPSPTTLPAGDTLELTITYQPNTTGPHTAVLNIGSDDANENPFVVNLTGGPHSVLDFEDFTNANKNTYGDRIGASPSVVVDFPESESPWFPWGNSYGNLIDVIYSTRGPASIVLTADPGKAVQLHSFQMAGYNQNETIKSLKVINGETNALLFNRTNVLLPGTSAANATFTFPTPLIARILIIRYDATNVPSGQSYVAIDTITFSDAMPDISVVGNLKEIVSGDTTPSLTDHTDFGRVNPINGSVERTFTIKNVAIAGPALVLAGPTSVSLSGPDAADFAITHQPLTAVAGKGSSTFKVVFDPTTAGLKNANVTVQSNDTDEGSYTFGISGFSGLATGTAQSLVLTAPPTAYLGQGTVALGVWSTSGLPVSLSVTGPATLSGQTLTLTGTGVVKVTATQAGAGDFNAATTVTKSISVLATPAALTLTHLLQVYDGTPRAISTLGPSATVTYKVGGVDTATPPTNAGSYPVKAVAGAVTKTGTLVIAKAPLYITPDDASRFTGQANPAFTPQFSGFIGGDTNVNSLTKQPVLTTTAKTTSPGGTYPITASGATSANYTPYYRPGTLTVKTYAGSYEALLSDSTPTILGKAAFNIVATGASFTGSLALASETAPIPMSGPVTTAPNGDATGSFSKTVNGTTYDFAFSLTSASQTVTLAVNTTPTGTGTAKPLLVLPPGRTVAYSGAHTMVIDPISATPATGPAGAGWATASISTTGVLTLNGCLGDGQAFTSTLPPQAGATPAYALFVLPYKPVRTQSFVAGEFSLAAHPALVNRRYVAASTLAWKKAGLAADVSYRSGIALAAPVFSLDPWLPPAGAVTLAARLDLGTGTPAPMDVSHTATGASGNAVLPTSLGLSTKNLISVLDPVANVGKWKAIVVPTTGAFSGSFEVMDGAVKRPATFSGVLRQPVVGDTVIGDGVYLLNPASGTEKTTGEVLITRP